MIDLPKTEKRLIPYLMNTLAATYDFVACNVKYKGSEADLLCLNDLQSTEIEIKMNGSLANDFHKTIFQTREQRALGQRTKTKHEELLKGNRVNMFYFLLPVEFSEKIYKSIPKKYGIMTYDSYVFKAAKLDIQILRDAQLLTSRELTAKDYKDIATKSYRHYFELPYIFPNKHLTKSKS